MLSVARLGQGVIFALKWVAGDWTWPILGWAFGCGSCSWLACEEHGTTTWMEVWASWRAVGWCCYLLLWRACCCLLVAARDGPQVKDAGDGQQLGG